MAESPDLTGKFQVDLKTLVVLAGIAFSWWDTQREVKTLRDNLSSQQIQMEKEKQEKKQELVDERAALQRSLNGVAQDLKMMGYDFRDIQIALARAGIDVPKRVDRKDE